MWYLCYRGYGCRVVYIMTSHCNWLWLLIFFFIFNMLLILGVIVCFYEFEEIIVYVKNDRIVIEAPRRFCMLLSPTDIQSSRINCFNPHTCEIFPFECVNLPTIVHQPFAVFIVKVNYSLRLICSQVFDIFNNYYK